jgi:hypothetical protein
MPGQNSLTIEFVGYGDAFGSAGRFNACFHVTEDQGGFLVDCGMSSLIGLKRRQVDLNATPGLHVSTSSIEEKP